MLNTETSDVRWSVVSIPWDGINLIVVFVQSVGEKHYRHLRRLPGRRNSVACSPVRCRAAYRTASPVQNGRSGDSSYIA